MNVISFLDPQVQKIRVEETLRLTRANNLLGESRIYALNFFDQFTGKFREHTIRLSDFFKSKNVDLIWVEAEQFFCEKNLSRFQLVRLEGCEWIADDFVSNMAQSRGAMPTSLAELEIVQRGDEFYRLSPFHGYVIR
jgi:hypothetical protein